MRSTEHRRQMHFKAYVRAWVAVAMMVVWTLAALTGFLMWLAPEGPRTGQISLLFGLAKHTWGEIHFWLSVLALAVTGVHLVVDWRALRGCVLYLASPRREPVIGE